MIEQEIHQKKDDLNISNDSIVNQNFNTLRENRIVLEPNSKHLLSMLTLEVSILSDLKDICTLHILSFCPNPKSSQPWTRFTISVEQQNLRVDLNEILSLDQEIAGYYSWHWTDGLLFAFESQNDVRFRVKIQKNEHMLTPYELPAELRQVQIVHVLDDGQKIYDHKVFNEKYQHLFIVDKEKIVDEILRLRPLTKSWNKSVVFVRQNGEFSSTIDVPSNWKP